MKKITIEQMCKVEKYEANDGKVFDNENSCIEYEERISLNNMIKNIPHVMVNHEDIFPSGCCTEYAIVFKPENTEQASRLLEWCKKAGVPTHLNLSQMNTTLVIPDCYISGNATLTGGEGWQGNEYTMVYDEATGEYVKVFSNVAACTYEFKVASPGWTAEYTNVE